MKRVCMLITNPFRPDPRMLREAESLVEAGYSVSILGWDRTKELPAGETLKSGINVIRIQDVPSGYGIGTRQLLRLPAYWRAVFPILNQLKPDILHCHDFDTLLPGLWWGRWAQIPVVYDAREYYADLVKPRLHGWSGKALYKLIGVSEEWAAKRAAAIITVDEILGEKYRRIHQQVLVMGHYPSRSMIQQPSLVFNQSELNLLYIGRLSEDRGVLLYADILHHLLVSGIPSRLHLAGTFVPEEDRALFEHHAREILKHIQMHGWVTVDQVPELLANVDLGLAILKPIPRFKVAIPQKLFEYMAAGIPIVVSRFPPIEKIIEPIQCGLLVEPLDDPKNIADRISNLWKHPEQPRKMGLAGRQAVIETYNWENLATSLVDLYHTLTIQAHS